MNINVLKLKTLYIRKFYIINAQFKKKSGVQS